MPDLPLPKLTPGDPENLLSHDARQRVGRAFVEYDLIRKRALSALDTSYRAEPGGCADFMEYLFTGQAGIDFAESRIKAASVVLRAEAEEYGNLGLPGRKFREIMEAKIDEMAYSLEFSTLQRDALRAEFVWTMPQQIEDPGPVESSEKTASVAERVRTFMEQKGLSLPAFAKMIGKSTRTVSTVLAGDHIGKETRVAVAKALGTTPEELFRK